MLCNRKSAEKRKRVEREIEERVGCHTPHRSVQPSPSSSSSVKSLARATTLSPPSGEECRSPSLLTPAGSSLKPRRLVMKSKRPRLTIAQALSQIADNKALLDPEEDSQVELPGLVSNAAGPVELEGKEVVVGDSDSDLECVNVEVGAKASGLAGIYGR